MIIEVSDPDPIVATVSDQSENDEKTGVEFGVEHNDDDLVEQVQEYIDPNSEGKGLGEAPVGAYCTVASATAENLTIDVMIKIKTGEVWEERKTAVQESINKYLADIAFLEPNNPDIVSYAQIGFAILSTAGVEDYADLLVNGGTDNVEIPNSDTARSVGVLKTFNATQLEI